jgi:NAD(P)-dependent dehydrogenase (short-subunit alcohol dehydrogenase family)
MQMATQALGGLDGLVNAAGVFFNKGLMETGPDIWNQTIAVNLTGTFLCVQAAVPYLLRVERATIVNIASGVGLLPTGGGSTAYVASKGGRDRDDPSAGCRIGAVDPRQCDLSRCG